MTVSSYPDILVRPPRDKSLVWTVAVSALAHIAAISLLLMAPQRFLGAAPPLESYTVELIAPDVLGGTNLIPGRGAKEEAAPVRKPPAPPPMVPPSQSTEVLAVPAAPPAKAEKKIEPEAKPAAAEKAPPPAAERPQRASVSKPKLEKAQEKVARKPEAKTEEVVAANKKAPPQQEKVKKVVEAKPQAPKTSTASKSAEPAQKAAPKPVADKPAAAARKPAVEQKAPALDDQIARAVQRRAAQVSSESKEAAPKAPQADLDQQIAAAVQRRIQQAGRAASVSSSSASGEGGPIGHGPGAGAGGVVKGIEYVLYRSQMEARIKAVWAWAGANRSLEAVIRFNITPAGEIINIRTVRSSGDRSYDASAERAVRAANPLGPPPEDYREDFDAVELTFRPEDLRS